MIYLVLLKLLIEKLNKMNKRIFKIGTFALLMGLSLTTTSCDKDEEKEPASVSTTQTTQAPQTIAEIALADENFSILVDALSRTNLVDVVNNADEELTVFAPTNDAFVALLDSRDDWNNLDDVQNTLGVEGLKNVLLYHVLGAEVKSADVATGYATTATENQLSLYINTSNGVVINDRATVTAVDIDASNGVVHVIDQVILPLSIFQLIDVNPEFSSLQTSLEEADGDLDALFADEEAGPFTLFAPNNNAFDDLLGELQLTTLPEVIEFVGGTDVLSDLLKYHALSGNVRKADVSAGTITTVNSQTFDISTSNGVVITDAGGETSNVIATDIQGTNGVFHIIDEVLVPTL